MKGRKKSLSGGALLVQHWVQVHKSRFYLFIYLFFKHDMISTGDIYFIIIALIIMLRHQLSFRVDNEFKSQIFYLMTNNFVSWLKPDK